MHGAASLVILTFSKTNGGSPLNDAKRALTSDTSTGTTPSLDGISLPAWIYRDADFLEAEKERAFASSWQIVCHSSDIPDPGDYHTLDFLIPISPTETLIREIAYAHADGRREMRAARYLNWRINRRVSADDKVLIERVQTGMGSRSYSPGPLGRNEVSLRSFAHRMRELLPESRLEHAPAPGWGGIKSRLSRG